MTAFVILDPFIHNKWHINKHITQRIEAGWVKKRGNSGELCNFKPSNNHKVKKYIINCYRIRNKDLEID